MPGVQQHWDEPHSPFSVEDSDMIPYRHSSVHSNGYSTGDGQQNMLQTEAPTYIMEHLATFTVARETGIVYPADGMRRLLQLEKSNGIWSQKMQMRLDRNWVLIMDFETGAVMERFPVSLIQDPTAFTSHDPMEIYNNILVFIVGDDRAERSERSTARSEMHIFQCQRISAEELVADLKLLRMGKVPAGRAVPGPETGVGGGAGPGRHIPPPPATPPPEPPNNGMSVRDHVSVFNAASHQTPGELGAGMYAPRDGAVLNDETSSTSSEKYERDVTILNHCFDDIEKFIARLQHAAAASRELERRRRSRKSKKKDLGDGMLTMRAKPPPEVEFVDIFQKFKLSFNLLAKLKAHIHDPNAPELVHFLFTPLALIVDASHDTHYGPNLPSKVVSPLLTREAVNLLINCVTSKETELWHSLGDAWLIPRDQWKGYVQPYHPVFLDGWSPEYPVGEEQEPAVGPLGMAPSPEDKRPHNESDVQEQAYPREPDRDDSHYSSDYFEYEQQDMSATDASRYYGSRSERYQDERDQAHSPAGSDPDFSMGPVAGRDASARSDISADSIERNGMAGAGGEGQQRFERAQLRWLDELRSRGAKVVQVTYPRTANNDKELTVIRGEYLEVVDDSRKWWKARNSRGQVAHVPHTIVTASASAVSPAEAAEGLGPGYGPARGYERRYSGQELPRDGAAGGDGRGTRSPPLPPPAPADWVRKQRLGKKDNSDLSSDEDSLPAVSQPAASPTPPPIPAATSPAPQTPKLPRSRSTTSLSKAADAQDYLMHEELKSVLTMFQKRRNLEIVKTPEVYIDQKSKPEEVQKWLKDKGFSEGLCTRLKGMSGNELFDLTRDQLETYCGKSEGRRLDSQITIQRNVSGYKTARSSELKAILAKVRSKVEAPDAEALQDSEPMTHSDTDRDNDPQPSSDHNDQSSQRPTKHPSHTQEGLNLEDASSLSVLLNKQKAKMLSNKGE